LLLANFSHGTLAMALRANANAITITHGSKVDRRLSRILLRNVARAYLFNVPLGRPVTHLAIYSGLPEDSVLHWIRSGGSRAELAGVANRTVFLIIGQRQ
jgi:hypothetical protein